MLNLDQINETLFVGTYPQNVVDFDRLKNGVGVTAVVSLQSDEDLRSLSLEWPTLKRYALERSLLTMRVPILDQDFHDLARNIKAAAMVVGRLEARGHRIYVHCTNGIGRSPTVAIAHLAWNHGWELDAAYQFVRQARTCDPSIEAIRAAEATPGRVPEGDES